LGWLESMRQLSSVPVAMKFIVPMNHESWYRMDAGLDSMF